MNRDRVEQVVTNELNGRELHTPTERLQQEAAQALQGRSAHETNQNYQMYNEMAARAHLPQLELVNERHAAPTHHAEHSHRPTHHRELPVPPIPPVIQLPEVTVTAPRETSTNAARPEVNSYTMWRDSGTVWGGN